MCHRWSPGNPRTASDVSAATSQSVRVASRTTWTGPATETSVNPGGPGLEMRAASSKRRHPKVGVSVPLAAHLSHEPCDDVREECWMLLLWIVAAFGNDAKPRTRHR